MIKYSVNTNKKATLKILNALSSYLFEQECGELRYCKDKHLKALVEAKKALAEIIKE